MSRLHLALCFLIRYNQCDTPFTECNLFKVFLESRSSKKELSQMVINRFNNRPVSTTTFNKIWKQMTEVIEMEVECL